MISACYLHWILVNTVKTTKNHNAKIMVRPDEKLGSPESLEINFWESWMFLQNIVTSLSWVVSVWSRVIGEHVFIVSPGGNNIFVMVVPLSWQYQKYWIIFPSKGNLKAYQGLYTHWSSFISLSASTKEHELHLLQLYYNSIIVDITFSWQEASHDAPLLLYMLYSPELPLSVTTLMQNLLISNIVDLLSDLIVTKVNVYI